eukprot:1437898-Amphidinium_carterae.1
MFVPFFVPQLCKGVAQSECDGRRHTGCSCHRSSCCQTHRATAYQTWASRVQCANQCFGRTGTGTGHTVLPLRHRIAKTPAPETPPKF